MRYLGNDSRRPLPSLTGVAPQRSLLHHSSTTKVQLSRSERGGWVAGGAFFAVGQEGTMMIHRMRGRVWSAAVSGLKYCVWDAGGEVLRVLRV
jgi:hypothetical protein